ncbi:MAG: DUF1289 domain-containing protein [Pseudomonadota bacterium]
MAKLPSPCIDVCKYRMRGHCIACSMTKAQKKAFKKIDGGKKRRAFVEMLIAQQEMLGGRFKGWAGAYRRKCAKKAVECPLDAG